MTLSILMGVETQLSIVQGKDNEAVMYGNSETGSHSLMMVKSVDCLTYVCDTYMEEGPRSPTIEHTNYI